MKGFDISVHQGGVKSGNLHNIAWSLHHRRERCDNDWKDRTESSNLYSYCLANRTATDYRRAKVKSKRHNDGSSFFLPITKTAHPIESELSLFFSL